jgi:hypothetical protein
VVPISKQMLINTNAINFQFGETKTSPLNTGGKMKLTIAVVATKKREGNISQSPIITIRETA